MKRNLLKEYQEQDELCTELINKAPGGYHDKEFEELLIRQARLEGYNIAKKEMLDKHEAKK